MEKWVTVKAAADLRKCTSRNVIDLIKRGKLAAKRDEDGRRWLVLVDVAKNASEESSEVIPKSERNGEIRMLREQVTNLQAELSESRKAAEDASQRHDTIVMQLTRQLEQSQRLLEYHREP
jgi:hypothetical protein